MQHVTLDISRTHNSAYIRPSLELLPIDIANWSRTLVNCHQELCWDIVHAGAHRPRRWNSLMISTAILVCSENQPRSTAG